jgi:transposase
MPRQVPPLECSKEDKIRLLTIRKSPTEDPRIVERAKIVLARAAGKEIRKVARDLNVSLPTINKWCRRFSLRGVRGLWDDPRPGKPPKYDDLFRDKVLDLLVQTPPEGMPAWEGRALAERLGSSVDAVWRVLRGEGIYLRRRRNWRAATETRFVPKRADVIGLYLNPPLNAAIVSASELPGAQIIESAEGYVETDSGLVVRSLNKFRRKRGGLRLTDALEAGAGRRRTRLTEQQKRADFQNFLNDILAEQPPGREIHVILDAGPMNREWLATFGGDVRFHFTTTSAQWYTAIEIVFGLFITANVKQTDDKAEEGVRKAIELFVRDHNEFAKAFRWRRGKTMRPGDRGIQK